MMAGLDQGLAAGVWAALYPTGSLLLSASRTGLEDALPLTRVIARLACGLMAWSLVLVTLAVADRFQPSVIGAVAWLGVIGWVLLRGKPRASLVPVVHVPWPGAAIVVLLLATAATLYAGWPKESLIAERDEAIYTLHAMHLLNTGENRIDMAALGLADSATVAAMASEKRLEMPGIYPTGRYWTFQFSVLPSAWMAQLAATAGDAGLFRFNALVSLLSGLALLSLLREWLPRTAAPWAIVGLALFALNPAQVWVSRVNLSEPLAQCFTISGLLLALLALRRDRPGLALLAGLLLGATVLVRIDSLLTLLLAAAAYPLCWALRSAEPASNRTWGALALGAAGMAALSVLYYMTQVSTYWLDHARYLLPLLYAGLPLMFAAALVASGRMPVPPRRWIAAGAVLTGVALLGVFGYAALLRPHLPPFSLLDSALVPQLTGTRDFRELSLLNLAAYLGWPVLLASLAGYLLATWRLRSGAMTTSTVLLVTVFLGTSLAFLWNPMISPDHVWASRRFVPAVIPGTLVFAVAAIAQATHGLRWRSSLLLAGALGLALSGQRLWDQRTTLFFAEDAGLLQALRQLDDQLPEQQRVVVGSGATLAATLLAGFGKPALPLLDGDFAQAAATHTDFAEACSAAMPCRWLHNPQGTYPGLQLRPLATFALPRQRIAATPVALAQGMDRATWPVALAEFTGLQPAVADRLAGEHRDWRLPEHGFWQDEVGAWGSVRWTDGDAVLRVPALPSRAIEVTLQVPADTGSQVLISVNDQTLFEGRVEGVRWQRQFAPPAADSNGYWTFRIQSDTFIAADRYGGEDRRRLGVKVESIRLLAAEPAPAWSAQRAMSARLETTAAEPSGSLPRQQLVSVRNLGDWSWPSLSELRPGESPVQLGILWVARGDSPQGQRLLEQRLAIPRRLEPGEDVLLPLVLDPALANGAKLPAADYDVIVSPVLEGTAWFHDHGVAPLRIPVEASEFP